MLKLLGKYLRVYEDEMRLFLWCAALFFLIRSSNILFNNFAETAFLKRYGVEYLPVVYVVNSISTFIIMGFMAGLMARLPGTTLLTYMLLFFGGSVAGLRFVIPFDFDLLYPVLFVLKSQYEILLALVFWNLANDLFNTRQSKRLFPLITAGGVLGGIIGSFGTPFLARVIFMDNLMLAYLGTTVLGAITVKRMGIHFPTHLLHDTKVKKNKSRPSVIEEFKKILPLIRESKLIKALILLTFLPNVVFPILGYQFNFAIDQTFATEGGMIKFFGYFNGILNIISLILLLFVGRIYGRWGLPVALMFHPFNYLLAFIAFLLRFDIFSAIYSRMSTNILKTTVNNPARAVLMGLIPASSRALIRPFLRGAVVRIGVLIGSGIIMFSEGFMHPRYLSLVAVAFIGMWIIATFFLKRDYTNVLSELISRNILDLKSMEKEDVRNVFMDKKVLSQLNKSFQSAGSEDCLWYARLLKSLGTEDLDAYILSTLGAHDDKTRIELLSLLSSHAGEEAIHVLRELANPANPDLMVALVQAANRLDIDHPSSFTREVFETSQLPEVKAYAVIGLYSHKPQKYKPAIDSWLESDDVHERKAGVIAARESEEGSYIPKLKELLAAETDCSILPIILKALHNLGAEDINALIIPYLYHPLEPVRRTALETFNIDNDAALKKVVVMMDDPSEHVQDLAKEKINTCSYQNAQVLVESLAIPRRNVREGIFDLLSSLNIKDLDVFRFARSQIEEGYTCLAAVEELRLLHETKERNLLIDHLDQTRIMRIENVLRVLVSQDRTGKMRIIWRGISSSDPRQRSNSLEALDDLMDTSLSRILMPLLENLQASQSLAIGRKNFQLPDFDSNHRALYSWLLGRENWVTVILTLNLGAGTGLDELDKAIISKLAESKNDHIRWFAQSIIDLEHRNIVEREDYMEAEISIPDKILHLKGIHIFKGLAVGELAAIASVTEEVIYPPGETVIKEGEPGETMYLIIKGEVSVIKRHEKENEIELDRIGSGDYFGEMALFEDAVRSATIRTQEASRLLVLHKREFAEIVREYPQIALHICKELMGRLRKLHEVIKGKGGGALN